MQLYPNIEAKEGSAKRIPLADASVDAVVCAQAFHWFANSEALGEIHRVLKPGGSLGLVWNVRDERRKWVAALTKIIEPFEGDAPRYHTQQWRRLFPADGFSPLRENHFSNEHTGSPEQVIIDRILSIRFIAALPFDRQQHVESRIRKLIATSPELAEKTVVTFPYETAVFSCRKLC